MREGWKQGKLGNVCAVKTGRKDVRQGNPDGAYPFFTCAKEHTYSDDYSFDAEAILIAGNGDVGHATYFKGKFEAYQRTYVLLDFKGVEPSYLFLVLDGLLKNALYDQRLGNTMPYIKKGMLTEFPIPLPPLPEQKRIVAILDEAFAGIATAVANTEKNLANARELFESSLASLIPQTSGGATPGQDWQSFKLGDICVVDWGNTSLTKKAYVDGGDFLAVSAAGPDGRIGHAEHKRFTPVLSAIGAKCGRMFFPEEDFTAIKNTITLTPVERLVTNRFLFFLLSVVTLPQRGAGQPFISKGDIQRFPAEIPPLPDQERIVTMLDELGAETRQLQFVYEQKLDALGELKSSLLQKAFSGELTAAPRGEIETALA